MNPAAVILGANFYIALGAIRTLGRNNVEVYALDYHFPTAYALSSKYIYKRIRCPDVNRDEKGAADFLIEVGKQFSQPPVLMSSADNYALMVSRYSKDLAPYYRFIQNPPGLLGQVIDKKGLYQLAQKHGLTMPLTYFIDSAVELNEVAEKMPYPCIIKPALSHQFVKIFRKKCIVIPDKDSLVKVIAQTQAADLEIMVQEIIPGFDDHMFVFDVYINNNEGRPTHTLTAQKLRQFPINFGSSTLTHHYHDQEIVDLGLEYMRRLGYRGYGEIEFKRHASTGKLYMIEINARLSSLNVLFDACGVEFTYIMYRDLIGDPVPDYHLREDRPWVFWHAYEDFISVTGYLRKKQLGLKQVLRPWFRHHKAHAIWASDDIKPFFAFSKLIFGKLTGKIKRLLLSPFTHFHDQKQVQDKG